MDCSICHRKTREIRLCVIRNRPDLPPFMKTNSIPPTYLIADFELFIEYPIVKLRDIIKNKIKVGYFTSPARGLPKFAVSTDSASITFACKQATESRNNVCLPSSRWSREFNSKRSY